MDENNNVQVSRNFENGNKDTKLCKYCQTEISKKAKVCPNCRKKQKGGVFKWIAIVIVALMAVSCAASIGGDESEPKKTGEIDTSEKGNQTEEIKEDSQSEESGEEEVSNVFNVGDVVETDSLKITFLSAELYEEENEFLQPKDGCEYWKFEFEFENISDSDQSVSSMMDWECYADNAKVDQAWIGDDNGLDATLSSGRTTKGAIFFEIPVGSESIELEYDINFWQSDKIIFVGK